MLVKMMYVLWCMGSLLVAAYIVHCYRALVIHWEYDSKRYHLSARIFRHSMKLVGVGYFLFVVLSGVEI